MENKKFTVKDLVTLGGSDTIFKVYSISEEPNWFEVAKYSDREVLFFNAVSKDIIEIFVD